MKTPILRFSLVALIAAACGCGSTYSWRSSVPADARTVSVPTFRNESEVAELGALAARQLLREFQREGTFSVRASGDAALEIQGVIKDSTVSVSGFDRRSGMRTGAFNFVANALVSVIDKRTRKVLVDNRPYRAETTFSSGQDVSTARRDASGRLMDDLARQVVDDVLNIKWSEP